MSNHLFDEAWYLSRNPDVAAAVERGEGTAYEHFMLHGSKEDRSFVPYFDAEMYLRENRDIEAAVDAGTFSATEHFLNWGYREVRPISPFFDLPAYLEANPDVALAVTAGAGDALSHLLTHGFSEGRDLGNGISLAQFSNDPTFQEAVLAGDADAAMARVAEVAPFIPTFEPPEGWEPAPDTPIPVDFVPVEGEKLVIPPSVEVPDDVDLPPDVFEPVEPAPEEPGEPGEPGEPDPVLPPVDYQGELSWFATRGGTEGEPGDYMFVGGSNLATDFAVSQIDVDEGILEIALGAQNRFGGPATYPIMDGGTVAITGGTPALKYSVAANFDPESDQTLAGLLEEYDIKLKIDIDPTEGEDFIIFNAGIESTSDGALSWTSEARQLTPDGDDDVTIRSRTISDDGGNAFVSQNIQPLGWLQPDADGELWVGSDPQLEDGIYSVVMEVYGNEGVDLIGATNITFDFTEA